MRNRNVYLSILEHFDERPFGHRACVIRTETGSIFDTLIYIIFLQITKRCDWMLVSACLCLCTCTCTLDILTFKASRLVFAFICGIQNRRELNAALSKLNRFLLKTSNEKIEFKYVQAIEWKEMQWTNEQMKRRAIQKKWGKKWIILVNFEKEMSAQSIMKNKMRK